MASAYPDLEATWRARAQADLLAQAEGAERLIRRINGERPDFRAVCERHAARCRRAAATFDLPLEEGRDGE